jgi:transposase-like protein
MKERFSEMGKLSSVARRGPDHEKLKAEAIRLHVEQDDGITAISERIGVNKKSIRTWLIAAGCYRAGHRPPRVREHGATLPRYKASDLGRKQIFAHILQRRAWQEEWKGAAKWDELRHWTTHPAKYNYIIVRRARQRRMKTSGK